MKAKNNVDPLIADGKAAYLDGKYTRARQLYMRAIRQLERQEPDSEKLAQAYLALTFVYFSLAGKGTSKAAEHQDNSIACYEKAIAIWEKGTDYEKLIGNLSNMSSLYYKLGRFADMAAANQKAIAIYEAHSDDIDPETMVAVWNKLGAAYHELGRLEDAERVLSAALEQVEPDGVDASYLLETLSMVYRSQGREADANAALERAADLRPPEACSIRSQ